MSDSRFTDGPWLQFDDGGTIESTGYSYGPEYADVVWGPGGPGHGVIADCSPYSAKATSETVANAKLIASATKMFSMIELIAEISSHLPTVIGGWNWEQINADANAIIKNVKGGAA